MGLAFAPSVPKFSAKHGRQNMVQPLALRRAVRISTMAMQSNDSAVTRREVLRYMIFAGVLLNRGSPAYADRTGKYSTKLTAKRRYLPRIARGVRFINASNVEAYVKVNEDFVTALQLFGTTYFAEGNRIGPLERELSEIAELVEEQTKLLVSDSAGAAVSSKSLDSIHTLVEKYIDVAKIRDSLVSFDTLQ